MQTRGVVVLAAIGAGLLGWNLLQARGAGATARATVATPALPEPLGVAAEGRVVTYPGAEVVVGAERAGRVVRVSVLEGQAVRRGELLAELDSDEIVAARDEARARVAEAEAELRLAEASLERRRQLAQERIVAAHDLDQAARDRDGARARLETARASVARWEAALRKTRIVAPISGTVVDRHVDAGETVEAGERLLGLADLSRLRVDAEADEADAAGIILGAPALVSSEAYPGRSWAGRVEEIADSVTLRKLKPQDPGRPTDTRILAVKVAFGEATPLKLGTTVELRIQPLPSRVE